MCEEDRENEGWEWMMQFVQNIRGILRIKKHWKMAGSLDLRKPADYKRQCCDPGEGWTQELVSLFRSEFCYLTFAKFLSLYLSVLICKMGIIT